MKKTIKKKELSNCCNAPVKVSTADEGTSCYVCTRCQKPCNILAKPFDGIAFSTQSQKEPEEWEDTFNLMWEIYCKSSAGKIEMQECVRGILKASLSHQRTQTIEEKQSENRNKIVCPHCHKGKNSSIAGGNSKCFHCDTCSFEECQYDYSRLWDEARQETIEEINMGLRHLSGQWEGQTMEWVEGNKQAFRDIIKYFDSLK